MASPAPPPVTGAPPPIVPRGSSFGGSTLPKGLQLLAGAGAAPKKIENDFGFGEASDDFEEEVISRTARVQESFRGPSSRTSMSELDAFSA